MSFRLPVYDFYVLQARDTLYAGYDEDNMRTIENQLAALLSFGKPGVISGWDVTAMDVPSANVQSWPGGNDLLDSVIIEEQVALIKGYDNDPDSTLGQQYKNLGLIIHYDTHTSVSGANSKDLYNPSSSQTGFVRVATTGNISTNYTTTMVDGVTLAANDLVLVKDQTDKTKNGIYLVNLNSTINGGNWYRAFNLNSSEKFKAGLVVRTGSEGASQPYKVYQLAANIDTNGNSVDYVLGTTELNWVDVWKQCIRVTPGTGIVGIFAATTICDTSDPKSGTYYFRYTGAGFYYVWAESGLFLVSDQECIISAPIDQDSEYDLYHTAAYLATVEVAKDLAHNGNAKILNIVYEDRRNQLKNLEGAQQEVIRNAFLHHIHAGGIDHPSKIKLDTQLILTAYGPSGSPIFELQDSSGKPFSGNKNDYGVPEVRLNNSTLPDTAYELTFGNPWKIYLKNSLPSGAVLQVILSMSPQVFLKLRTIPSGTIHDTILYLTDGTVTTSPDDDEGNGGIQSENTYTWDPALWIPKLTMTDIATKIVIEPDPSTYTLVPSTGQVIFLAFPTGTFDNSSLSVVLTKVGVEVTGKLSGKRIGNIDASLFNQGVLNRNRIVNLDHIGQVRLNDTAVLRPSLRLLSLGDKYTFYPELTNTPLQYTTEVNCMVNSQNINSGKTTLGTKRGMMSTSDYYLAYLDAIWKPDIGNIKQIQDALLPGDPKSNYLHTTFIRTEEGKIYKSVDSGSSWQYVPVPPVQLPGAAPSTPVVTALFCSLDKQDSTDELGFVTTTWFTDLLVGTEHNGVLSASALQGTALTLPSPLTGTQIFYDESGVPVNNRVTNPGGCGKVHAITQVIAINKTFDPDTHKETDTVVRSTFVGCDTGFYVNNHRLTTDIVKGFLVLNNNDLIWFTDHDVFVTHSSGLTTDPDTGNQTWTLPLSTNQKPIATVAAATTLTDLTNPASGNIVLSGLQTIDGVSLTATQLVLVKNQTNATQNGIYRVSAGAWTRLDRPSLAGDGTTGRYSPGDWVSVSGGTVNGGSSWMLPSWGNPSYILGTDAINWTVRIFKILSKPSQTIHSIAQRTGYNQYFVCANNAMQLITDSSLEVPVPHYIDLIWYVEQGSANALVPSAGQVIVASDRGLWKSTDDLLSNPAGSNPWKRVHSEFSFSSPTSLVYNEHDLSIVSNWSNNANFQSFVLAASDTPHTYNNLIYERDFTDYYVDPWKTPYPIQLNPEIDSSADVFVYVNGELSSIAYTLYPEIGLIKFTQPLSKDDRVSVNIIRKNAYISNTGNVPHLEVPNSYLIAPASVTTLSKALAPQDLIITVSDPQAIPITSTLLEIRNPTNASIREKISITVDPITRQINIPYARATAITYPAGSGLYLVTNGSELGLEDLVIKTQTNQPFNFNSLSGTNQIQLGIAAKKYFTSPSFFNNYIGDFVKKSRGLKNSVLFDFNTDALDPKASSSSITVSQLPANGDSAVEPLAVYNIASPTIGGAGMLAGTDQGVWVCNTSYWRKQSALQGASRTYFLDNTVAGTDKGLFRKGSDGAWVADLTFTQTIFDYLPKQQWNTYDSTGGPTYFEAYGKDDGLSFIYYNDQKDSSAFVSDHFEALDLKRVYGLWSGIFYRISFDAAGNMIQTPSRALYLCTEIGLYAVTLGSRQGEFTSVLNGREMFGDRIPMVSHTLPNGGVEQIPVKFYKIFKFLATPPSTKEPIPIILLSNNGIYKVTNWRWCDPTDAASLNFYADSHLLEGVSCYCYVTHVTGDGINTPAVSKAFVGTDRGVYKSFNGGGSWDACERINGGLTTVFDIKITSASNSLGYILIAATQNGIFYSDDDGDTWYRPTTSNISAFDYHITSARHFNDPGTLDQGGYLAQTFTIPSDAGSPVNIIKISAYLSLTLNDGQIQNYEASLRNTLQADIYAVDANGLPTGSPLTQSTLPDGSFPPDVITASDVTHPGFYSLFLPINSGLTIGNTYALVLKENVVSTGSAIFKWHASSISDPYGKGKALSGGNSGDSWAEISNTDFFFKVYFAPPSLPTTKRIDADFSQSTKNGLVLNDINELTTDFKFAISTCLDDSHSMLWSDPGLQRGQKLYDLLNALWSRSSSNWPSLDGSKLFGNTFVDFWVYGIKILERTLNGYTSDIASIQTNSSAIYQKGNVSELYDALSIALSTLSPQSIIDAIITEDQEQTRLNVQNLVSYLASQNTLRLNEIQNWFSTLISPSGWDGSKNTIHNFTDVSSYVVERWSRSFIPLGIVAADGDTTTSTSPSSIGLQSQTLWQDQGAPVLTIGLGSSQLESGLRTIAKLSNGKHFVINTVEDWSDVKSSLLHGGDNNLFKGEWSQKYDFDNATFVQYVWTSYSIPGASGSHVDNIDASCVVQFRYTLDRANWSNWITLNNASQYNLNELVLGLEYSIVMKDGWDVFAGGVPLKPSVSELFYIQVNPSVQYLITYPYEIKGMFFEHLLSASIDLPKSARAQWGVCRGLSNDFADFELIINNRRSCLANRQQSILFTTEIDQLNLKTLTTDNQTFTVYDSKNNIVLWSTKDQVTVFVNGREISSNNYSLNGGLGQILFSSVQVPGIVVTVNIITPEQLYTVTGEPSSTKDGRTYYVQNGRWPSDATAIVLVNGQIVRGGYWSSPEDGTVTFAKERERTDIVTVFIQHVNQFRIGVALYNYSTSPIIPDNFGLYYSAQANKGVVNQYYNTQPPSILNDQVVLSPSPASVNQRLSINYTFNSIEGSVEAGTKTTWWRKIRTGEDQSNFHITSNGFVQLTAANGLPEYNNRFVERSIDVGGSTFQNSDKIYVIVYPSDGFNTGIGVASNVVTLGSQQVPYVNNLLAYNVNRVGVWVPPHVQSPSTDPNFQANPDYYQIKAGLAIEAMYAFSGAEDHSIVTWFEKSSLGEPYYVGKIVPPNKTVQGQILYFTVQPYDGTIFGNTMTSETVSIN